MALIAAAVAALAGTGFWQASPASAATIPASDQAAVSALQAKGFTCGPDGNDVRCSGFTKHSSAVLTPAERSLLQSDLSQLKSGTQSSANVAAGPPVQCGFDGFGGVTPDPDRFTSCGDTIWVFSSYVIADGTPILIGTFTGEDEQWANYSATSSSWTHGLLIAGLFGTGELTEGLRLQEISSGCDTAPSICLAISQASPDPQSAFVTPVSVDTFGWLEFDQGPSASASGQVNYLDPSIGVDLTGVSPNGGAASFSDNDLAGRCDTRASTTDGCVDEDYAPTLTYDANKNPLVDPVVLHIYTNQQPVANGGLSIAWGVPKSVRSNGSPLYRDTSSADQTANRKVACAGVVLATGQSCDEWPLASTYEGAAFQNVWSAWPVPEAANSSQGGLTGTFYKANRILDGVDPFYVKAIQANGPASW